ARSAQSCAATGRAAWTRPVRSSGQALGDPRQLETPETRETRGRIDGARRRRADAEERRQRRRRLIARRCADHARRVDGVPDGAVVEEAVAELPDDARFRRAADLRLTAAARALRRDVARSADVGAADARV